LRFQWIGNAIQNLAVLDVADANTSFPARMRRHAVGFGVAHIDHIPPDIHSAGPAKLFPLAEIFSVLIEYLNAHIASICDKKAAVAVHRDVVRSSEFSRARSQFTEGLYEFAVPRKFRD